MGARYFRAGADGSLARVSLAQMDRWSRGEPLPPALAKSPELKFLVAEVETDGRQVARVLRIVPHRHGVGRDKKLDMDAAVRLAMKRMGLVRGKLIGTIWVVATL